MTAQIIDGKAVAAAVRAEVRTEVAAFRERFGRAPGLATVLVGADPASATYVRNKRTACAECGIDSIAHELPASTTRRELLELVEHLNARADADGILVQLPLPPAIDASGILDAMDPAKDVDGLHPSNQAGLITGRAGLRPCTPLGVMRLLDTAGVELRGNKLRVNPSIDVNESTAYVLAAKRNGGRSGVVLWGGGSPKNFTLQTEPQIQEVLRMKEVGQDFFIQVTDARPDTGGLSGATPGEAVSWGKVDPTKLPDAVVCYTDTTIAMPILTHYALAKHKPRKLKRLYDARGKIMKALTKEYFAHNKVKMLDGSEPVY